MRLILFILAFLGTKDVDPCSLQGRVRIKESFADYKVYVQDFNADVNVQIVGAFANKPGKWRFVQNNEDFSIQFVQNKARADFTINFVQLFPGC